MPNPPCDVIKLDEALVVRSPQGREIRRIRSALHLSVQDKTLVPLPGIYEDRKQIYVRSASAHQLLAGRCGCVIDHPDTVTVNGVEQPNGSGDDKTDRIWFRARCGGYTSLGTPYVTDRTVCYDMRLYDLADMIAKARDSEYRAMFKVLPTRHRAPGATWADYAIDSSTTLWVDCSAIAFLKFKKQMTNRRKTADRTAQTFADRNAIAAHPAIPQKSQFTETEVDIPCVCWYAPQGGLRFDKSTLHVDLPGLLAAHGEEAATDAAAETLEPASADVGGETREEPAANESAGEMPF